MPQFSYVQTDFRGGLWSKTAQGRMSDEKWKTALNVNLNAWPLEIGAWQRRPGFRFIHITRKGRKAELLPFSFGRDQAYQAEITAGKIRFIAGLDLLRDVTSKPKVDFVTSTPGYGQVYGQSYGADYGYGNAYGLAYGGELATWVQLSGTSSTYLKNGDTIIFDIVTEPPSSYELFGRQFEVADIDASGTRFRIVDPVTGSSPTGILFYPRDTQDTVQRVLEFDTPYTEADLPFVRVVQSVDTAKSDDVVLFLCPGKTPYVLRRSGTTQFTFLPQDFIDGPYLDVNETLTTLTPSGTTGTITLTASSTVGINLGDGFKSTDVGRLVRFQCGPPNWTAGPTFATNSKVIGSDGNIYRAVKRNSGNDPTTDSGSFWEITPDTVFWTWLKITAVTSSTVVSALVRGEDLQIKASNGSFTTTQSTTAPTTSWRLGLYTDTVNPATGKSVWPTCGAFHEGRLWLSGAIPNRVDASRSLGKLDFGPTYSDGTVADDNGLSFTLNHKDASPVHWMLAAHDGLALGTNAGEWVIRASQLDDPITPFDVQARPTTFDGSANEEVGLLDAPLFIQAARRRISAMRRSPYGKIETENLSFYVEGLMSPSLYRMAVVQEPLQAIFAIRTDGKLLGCSYRQASLSESFIGWHEHEHGYGRIFESLSSGPNFQGTADALFVVTAKPGDDSSVTNPRWVETIMPVATSGDERYVAWHTDGSSTAHYVRRMIVANGDPFDGIRVYGLHHLNGLTVHPFIGQLDLGDFIVDAGTLDLPFTGAFTLAFLEAANNANLGDWGVTMRFADSAITTASPQPLNAVGALVSTNGAITIGADDESGHWDEARNEFYHQNFDTKSVSVVDATTGEFLREAPASQFFLPGDTFPITFTSWVIGVSEQSLFGPVTTAFFPGFGLFDGKTLTPVGRLGAGEMKQPGISGIPFMTTYTNTTTNKTVDLAVFFGQTSAFVADHLYAVDMSVIRGNFAALGIQAFAISKQFTSDPTETSIAGCRGVEFDDVTIFYVWGFDASQGSPQDATRLNLYKATIQTGFPPAVTLVATIRPHHIDPEWTQWVNVTFAYDIKNGGLFGLATRFAGGGSPERIFKLETGSYTFAWNVPVPAPLSGSQNFLPPTLRLRAGYWIYISGVTSPNNVYVIDLADGSVNASFTAGEIEGIGGASRTHIDENAQSIVFFSGLVNQTLGPMTPIGAYATANPLIVDNWVRFWLGFSRTQDQDHRELNADAKFIPANFGISFTSRGQLLRPDFGQDAGAAAGPAFGKIRRTHWWSAHMNDTFSVSIGTRFNHMLPIKFINDDGIPTVAPDRFSGVITSTLEDNYSKEGGIAWECNRQYPCTITSIGGYVMTQDK